MRMLALFMSCKYSPAGHYKALQGQGLENHEKQTKKVENKDWKI